MNSKLVIIGGGAAGISVAASLLKHNDGLSFEISIIDPAERHYYQPAFTLVGGGCYNFDKTYRSMQSLIPKGASWVAQSVQSVNAEANQVVLDDGTSLDYDFLVVCPGLTLDWQAIDGLADAIGKNGVCSNYSPEHVRYTWECLQAVQSNQRLFFTQPPLPFKCPGAPQKIAYLAADYLKSKRILDTCELHFATAGPGMFGVPYFAKQLVEVIDSYGIHKDFLHKLIKIDGAAKTATFEITDGDNKGDIRTESFDLIHVTPSQKTPDFLHGSEIANASGFVEVDKNSMQHVKYDNIFSLGDACDTPNSKTAAAVRKQSPTVVQNIKNCIKGAEIEKSYNGYGSCPLTVARGKVLMAEFIYGGKVTPTMPLLTTPHKPNRLNWYCKTTALPMLYWDYMLKGHEKFFEPHWDFTPVE